MLAKISRENRIFCSTEECHTSHSSAMGRDCFKPCIESLLSVERLTATDTIITYIYNYIIYIMLSIRSFAKKQLNTFIGSRTFISNPKVQEKNTKQFSWCLEEAISSILRFFPRSLAIFGAQSVNRCSTSQG